MRSITRIDSFRTDTHSYMLDLILDSGIAKYVAVVYDYQNFKPAEILFTKTIEYASLTEDISDWVTEKFAKEVSWHIKDLRKGFYNGA